MVVRFSTTRESPMSPFHATVNMRLPLLTRAMGRAYLAFCPTAERKYILGVLARSAHPEDRVARHPEEVREIIARVRRNGFAEGAPDVQPRSVGTARAP